MAGKFLPLLTAAMMVGQTPDVPGQGTFPRSGDRLQEAVRMYTAIDESSPAPAALFKEAAADGDPRAALWMARLRLKGWCGVERDMTLAHSTAAGALDDVKKMAASGDAEAQFILGACYAEGLGVRKNVPEAVKLYEKAAGQGHILAVNNYAVYLAKGDGVEADIGKARILLERARKGGNSSARGNIALYSPPDRKSKMRFAQLAGSKFFQAAGKTRDEAIRTLVANGIITSPDAQVDAKNGGGLEVLFEDDVVTLYFDGEDRLVGIFVPKFNPASGLPRDEIPFGVEWSDNEAAVLSRLGSCSDKAYMPEYGAVACEYTVGNYMFCVLLDHNKGHTMRGWLLRRIWNEDPKAIMK